jgi:dihydrofolate reductase
MRNVVLMMSVSLDGFIEGPDRNIEWHMVDDELHWHFNEQLARMGAFLDGRVTYELMAEFWPTAAASHSSHHPTRRSISGSRRRARSAAAAIRWSALGSCLLSRRHAPGRTPRR